MLTFTALTDSAYSPTATTRSLNSRATSPEGEYGQAITAPGRVSPFEVPSFPLPPLSYPQPVIWPSRALIPSPPQPALYPSPSFLEQPNNTESSLFEYADYAGSRESLAARSSSGMRQTPASNKQTWDGQSMAPTSVYSQYTDQVGGSVYGGVERYGSKAASGWGDKEPSPQDLRAGLARAL